MVSSPGLLEADLLLRRLLFVIAVAKYPTSPFSCSRLTLASAFTSSHLESRCLFHEQKLELEIAATVSEFRCPSQSSWEGLASALRLLVQQAPCCELPA